MKKPKPVATNVKCSVCDLPWADHGEDPTLETCIELLTAALKSKPSARWPLYESKPMQPQPWYPITWSSAGNTTGTRQMQFRDLDHPVFKAVDRGDGDDTYGE